MMLFAIGSVAGLIAGLLRCWLDGERMLPRVRIVNAIGGASGGLLAGFIAANSAGAAVVGALTGYVLSDIVESAAFIVWRKGRGR